MKDIGKFRQYIYYLGTSCDITKLRNKIHKLKSRINRNFFHQRELIGKSAALIGSFVFLLLIKFIRLIVLFFCYSSRTKSELAIRRFEKCLCFTLASLNYYEDLLHKYSMLLVYFPLPTTGKIMKLNKTKKTNR